MEREYKNIVDTLVTRSILNETFSPAEIEFFAKNSDFQRYTKDTQIMTEGEPAVSLMFIMSGKVRVFSQDHQLAILQEGDMFGKSMFSDEGSRMAHIIALADTTTVVFTMDKYEKPVKETLGIALKYEHFFNHFITITKTGMINFFM